MPPSWLARSPNLTYLGWVLTLPAGHTESELELARLLAEALSSEELHVFWSAVDSGPCRVQDPKE